MHPLTNRTSELASREFGHDGGRFSDLVANPAGERISYAAILRANGGILNSSQASFSSTRLNGGGCGTRTRKSEDAGFQDRCVTNYANPPKADIVTELGVL